MELPTYDDDLMQELAVERRLDDLTTALVRETRLVHELGDTLRAQRGSVATNDSQAIHESIESVGHILLLLGEARRARAGLVATLTGDESCPLERLEDILGNAIPPTLARARQELRRAAEHVGSEVTMNREVLRRAVAAGEAFLQALFSSVGDAGSFYGPREREAKPPTGGMLNRRV